MKKIASLTAVLALMAFSVRGQVGVGVAVEQDQFLRGEAIKLAISITNNSGRDLHFGSDEDWLTFTVQSAEGGVVPKLGEVPVKGEFVLESARRATKRVNVEPFFGFSKSGRYSVVANVRIKEWDQERKSSPKSFYIIEGAKLWEQDFGLPKTAGNSTQEPEVRKYTLQQANYIKGQLRLYLRVSDASGGQVMRTVPIGTMLSFSHPEPQIDRESNLHLIYQNWAKTFTYSVYNPEGELVNREVYDYVDSRPRLRVQEGGTVAVLGGVKRVSANDAVKSGPDAPDLPASP